MTLQKNIFFGYDKTTVAKNGLDDIKMSDEDRNLVNGISDHIGFIRSLASSRSVIPGIIFSYDYISVSSYIPWCFYSNELIETSKLIGFEMDEDQMTKFLGRFIDPEKDIDDSDTEKYVRGFIVDDLGFSVKSLFPNTNIENLYYNLNKLALILLRLRYFNDDFVVESWKIFAMHFRSVIRNLGHRFLITSGQFSREEFFTVRSFIGAIEFDYEVYYRKIIDPLTLINYRCWNWVMLPIDKTIISTTEILLHYWNEDPEYQQLLRGSLNILDGYIHISASGFLMNDNKSLEFPSLFQMDTKMPRWEQAVKIVGNYYNLDKWIINTINGKYNNLKRKAFGKKTITIDEFTTLVVYTSKFDGWQKVVPGLISQFFGLRLRRVNCKNGSFYYEYDSSGEMIKHGLLGSCLVQLNAFMGKHLIMFDIYNPEF